MWIVSTPLNFGLHQSSCHVSCIILRIAPSCIDLRYISLVCAFGSSRVEPEYEQYEQEYEHPQEDRACASTADLTGEPTPSPVLHFHALLIYCYPYVAILLCHVSYPPDTYISEIHLLALPVVCCLPALRVVGEFRVSVDISRCSGYLVGMLTLALPFRKRSW